MKRAAKDGQGVRRALGRALRRLSADAALRGGPGVARVIDESDGERYRLRVVMWEGHEGIVLSARREGA